jgi:helicase
MLHIIIHPLKSKLIILPIKDNSQEPNFYGTLILKHTPKGARVGKFRIRQSEKEDFRAPEKFIYSQGFMVSMVERHNIPQI